MSESLVTFDAVSKRFGTFTAVDDLHLQITAGEFVALMGPSGCGKTTTLRMLAGLETPDDGEIRIAGARVNEVPAHQRETPLVWQSLALFPFLSVRENVEFGLKMRGIDSAERKVRALDWLERMEIAGFSERHVASLSGGQRQRVALARALVTEPRILLLDEPLSALDANLVVRMQAVLTRLHRELGITFIYVTHSQSEAFAMADRVVIMNAGKIEQTGTSRDIYRAPANRFVAEFVGRNNIVSGVIATGSDDQQVHIDTNQGRFAVLSTGEPPAIGTSASFAIGADLMQLQHHQPASGNSLQCQVISEEFVGAVVTVYLESDTGEEFKAQLQQRELDSLNINTGDRLWLSWSANDASLIEAER